MDRDTRFSSIPAITLAYVAGLFDGEGHVAIYPRKDHMGHHVAVTIVNTDGGVIEWLTKTLGGSSYARQRGKSNWRQTYTWRLGADDALAFLQSIHPYSKIKRNQIEMAVCFSDSQSHEERNLLVELMRSDRWKESKPPSTLSGRVRPRLEDL